MARYGVTIDRASTFIEVEASNYQEAEDKAYEVFDKQYRSEEAHFSYDYWVAGSELV